jgi:hypothetical protein
LCTVTRAPAATVRVDGEKAKFLMVMVVPVPTVGADTPDVEVVGAELADRVFPHAANRPAETTKAAEATNSRDGRIASFDYS